MPANDEENEGNIKNINPDILLCVYSMHMRNWTPKIEYMGRLITILLKNLFISHKINISQKGGFCLHISLLIKTSCGKENIID